MMDLGTKAMDKANEIKDEMVNVGRQVWFAGLGAMAIVEEKGRSAFDTLVEKGKTNQPQVTVVNKVINQAQEQVETIAKKVETAVQETGQAVMHRFGMPTHGEIQSLIARVEALTTKVEGMTR